MNRDKGLAPERIAATPPDQIRQEARTVIAPSEKAMLRG